MFSKHVILFKTSILNNITCNTRWRSRIIFYFTLYLLANLVPPDNGLVKCRNTQLLFSVTNTSCVERILIGFYLSFLFFISSPNVTCVTSLYVKLCYDML
jgi:hypothetical protein